MDVYVVASVPFSFLARPGNSLFPLVVRQVLRSYDNRFRKTDQSPVIYLSPKCKNIVGEATKSILQLPEQDSGATNGNDEDGDDDRDDDGDNDEDDDDFDEESFWSKPADRTLQIIATPFREGIHVASSPRAFLPIISELKKLHEAGFVHGDIRAFNIVWDEKEN